MFEFLRSKDVVFSPRRYFIDAMGAMTLGLFASLIMGLIFSEIGERAGLGFMVQIGGLARGALGYAIGVSVAFGLKAPPLVLFSCAAAGFMGNEYGGPAGAFIAAVVAAEAGKIIAKQTKFDILLIPAVVLTVGYATAWAVGAPIQVGMEGVGRFIMWATELWPILMGIIVAIVMGITLTSPISSAAIAIMLGLDGIAAGAAAAGCAANMVGFAVISFKENRFSGLISQGLGTSMLQMPNIVKNPMIWIPPIVASAVAGPVSAAVFAMENIPTAAGMGTSGLVGPFGAFTAMGFGSTQAIQVAIVFFAIPAIVSLACAWYMRRRGWIKPGDLTLGV